jgi:hypothetical protein
VIRSGATHGQRGVHFQLLAALAAWDGAGVIPRPVTSDDTEALLALYRAADLAEVGQPKTSAADITDLLHAPG